MWIINLKDVLKLLLLFVIAYIISTKLNHMIPLHLESNDFSIINLLNTLYLVLISIFLMLTIIIIKLYRTNE